MRTNARTAKRGSGGLGWQGLGALVAVCLLAVGCFPTSRTVESRLLPGWRALVEPSHLAGIDWLPSAPLASGDAGHETVVVVDPNLRPGGEPWSEPQRAAMRAFVERGGRLVLFGHATALAAQIGFDDETPEGSEYRWGFDSRALEGSARLGLLLVSGRAPELFEGLPTTAGTNVFLLAGGTPCRQPLCGWSIGPPKQGEVLARLLRVQDDVPDPSPMPVLVRWRRGNGEVIGCGLLPEVDHGDELVRDTARGFVQRCLGADRRVTIFVLPDRSPPPPPTAASWPRSASYLAHWGWRAGLEIDDRGSLRTPDELLQDVVTPSWQCGADALELELTLADGRLPLGWRKNDPFVPPADYRGGDTPPWSRQAFGHVAAELHGRGMLALGCLDPMPVGPRATERLVALRFAARELAGLRRGEGAAFDGFGVAQWWPDRDGYGVSMVQDFQPAAVVYRVGEGAPALAGGLRALDADDGAPRGSAYAGVTSSWRDGFEPEAFPIGVLDARATRDPRPVTVRGGGAEPDWLVAQANDFVRDRIGRGGTMLWRRHDPRTLAADTVAYVEGLSLEPLRCAVAMPLAATGIGGRRAASAATMPSQPAGFGATSHEPAAVHVLQNNWFRLAGSGGALTFDRGGLARFGDGALELSPSLMRCRLFGGRPAADAVRGERVDLLGTQRRGESGYERELRIPITGAERSPPAVIAVGEAPTWPEAVVFEWRGAPGYHELELLPRAVRGAGVLRIDLDGTTLCCLPFRAGDRAEAVTVPVHVARPGLRYLRLEVLEGGALALDRLALRRAGDVGVESVVVVPAGSRAELAESSSSSYHAEKITLATVADLPGFVLRFACARATRNLQVERTFRLPGRSVIGDDGRGLRKPFVLRADDGTTPDLVVAPMQLARYDQMVYRNGELVLRQAPEPGSETAYGFLIVDAGEGERWLPHANEVLAATERPLPLPLGADGQATLQSAVPMPWAHLVALADAPPTPCLVREDGWWSWRGTQAAPDGGRWLRVVQTPGEPVQVLAGASVFARTHPGPGSLHVLQLREPSAHAVEVRVLQPSRLSPPCVVMADDFDEVTIDGKPWAHFDDRTVFLPDVPGTYRVATRAGGVQAPHVRRTRAPLAVCAYVPERRELVLIAGNEAGRPPELRWTAVLAGPVPTRVENGEIVDVAKLRLPDVEQEALAKQGGVLVRFGNGGARVIYGD